MADVGALIVKISADAQELHREFGRMGRSGQDFGDQLQRAGKIAAIGLSTIATAAIGAGTAIFATVKATANAGDEALRLSQKTGESVETMSAMTHVARLNDVEMRTLEGAYKALSISILEAAQGSKEQKEAFQLLNVTTTTTTGTLRPAHQVMLDVADRLAAMENGTLRAALAQKVMSRSGVEMLPILVQGSAAIRAQQEEARRLGVVWSTEAAVAADDFNDNLERMGAIITGVRNIVGNTFLPVLNRLVLDMLGWFQANEAVIKQRLQDWALRAARGLEEMVTTTRNLLGAIRDLEDTGLGALIKSLGWVLSLLPPLVDIMIKTGRVIMDVVVGAFLELERGLAHFAAKLPGVGAQFAALEKEIEQRLAGVKATSEENWRDLLEAVGLIQRQQQAKQLSQLKQHTEERITEVKRGVKVELDAMKDLDLQLKLREHQFELEQDLHKTRVANEELSIKLREYQFQLEEDLHHTAMANKAEYIEALKGFQAADEERFAQGRIGVDQVREGAIEIINAWEDMEKQRVRATSNSSMQLLAIEQTAQARREAVVRQFPTFMEQQLQAIVQSNAFSLGSIVSTWTSSIATMIVKGGDLRAAWEATQIAILQSGLNTLVQWAAQAALTYLKDAAAHGLAEATKTSVSVAADATRTASTVAAASTATAAVTASVAAQTGVMAAFATSAMAMLTAVWTMAKAIMASIAAAMKATIFGIPVGLAITAALIAGAVMVASASREAAALMGAAAVATAGLTFFQHGGIVTRPTLGMIGEKRPETILPFDIRKLGGAGLMNRPIEVPVYLDGREIARASARYQARAFSGMGATPVR